MREIARLEPVPRGAYTGSLGYVSGAGCDFNILIRSFTFAGGVGYVSGGGGDVIESDAAEEYLETRHKVEALLHVLGRGRGGREPALPVVVRSWRPPRPRAAYDAHVLFVECHDSFSYNIVNYLRMLGAQVTVVDHEEDPARYLGVPADVELAAARAATRPEPVPGSPGPGPTHVVIGPGPGDPYTSGRVLDWLAAVLAERLPFLGVCLGHQALGVALGATLERAPRPIHGEDHPVRHDATGHLRRAPRPGAVHALPLAAPRRPAARARRTRVHARRRADGRRAPAAACLGRAVPPREHAEPLRPRPAGELPRAAAARGRREEARRPPRPPSGRAVRPLPRPRRGRRRTAGVRLGHGHPALGRRSPHALPGPAHAGDHRPGRDAHAHRGGPRTHGTPPLQAPAPRGAVRRPLRWWGGHPERAAQAVVSASAARHRHPGRHVHTASPFPAGTR